MNDCLKYFHIFLKILHFYCEAFQLPIAQIEQIYSCRSIFPRFPFSIDVTRPHFIPLWDYVGFLAEFRFKI